jgi:hypothetical protein
MTDRSAPCIATPPDITGTGDDEIEWFVRVGPRGAHRRLQPGDHLGLDHTLVQLFPDHFDTSPELANTICLSRPTAEVLTAREQERRRLMPRYVQIIRWRCENCGFELDGEAIIPPAVQALDVASALDAAEDLEQRARIQYWSVTQQQRRLDGLDQEQALFDQLRSSHVQCDPSRELHPLPDMPERDPSQPIPVWSGPVSIRQ